MWRRVVVAAMFLADDEGMCEWATLSLLFFSFFLSLSHTTHSPHHPPRPDRITASSVLFN